MMEVVKAFALVMSLWMIQGAAARELVSVQTQQAARTLKTFTYSDVKLAYERCPRVTCTYNTKTRGYSCTHTYPAMICCGGDTGVICPALACSYAFTVALSAPGGCAVAEAQVSALSVNPTNYNAVKLQLKKVFEFFAVDEQKTQANFFDTLEVVTKIVTDAVSLSCVKGFEYVCTKPCIICGTECPTSRCSSPVTPNRASAAISGLAQSAARAIAQALSEAWYEVYSGHPGMLQFAGESLAIGGAVADATNIAIAKMNKQYLTTDKNVKCDKENVKTEFAQAFAKAFVCDVAKATVLYFGDNGQFFTLPDNGTVTHDSTNLALVSCTSSVSAAFSLNPYKILWWTVDPNADGAKDAAKQCLKRCDCEDGQVAVTGYDGKDYCIAYGLVTTTDYSDIQPEDSSCFSSVSSTGVSVCSTLSAAGTKIITLPAGTTSVQLKCKTETGWGKSLKVKVSGTQPGPSGGVPIPTEKIDSTGSSPKFFGAYYVGHNGYLTTLTLEPSSSSVKYCCEFIKASNTCPIPFPLPGACDGNDCY